jgi:hypothetical protein
MQGSAYGAGAGGGGGYMTAEEYAASLAAADAAELPADPQFAAQLRAGVQFVEINARSQAQKSKAEQAEADFAAANQPVRTHAPCY